MDTTSSERDASGKGSGRQLEFFQEVKVKAGADAVQTLLCAICHSILYSVVQASSCGCRFCNHCLEREVTEAEKKNTSYQCPRCHVDIKKSEYFPDVFAEREVMALDAYCAAHQQGCSWEGTLSEYKQHQVLCPYMLVPCPKKGCQAFVSRHTLEHHSRTVCVGRSIDCEQCGKEVLVVELDKHVTDECPKATVSCPNGCGTSDLIRDELSNHHKVCTRVKVKCYYSSSGCEYYGYRGDLPNHHTANVAYHMQLIHQVAEATKQNMNELRHDNTKLRRQYDEVHDENIKLRLEMKRISVECAALKRVSEEQRQDLSNEKRARSEMSQRIDSVVGSIDKLKARRLEDASCAVGGEATGRLRHFEPKGGRMSDSCSSLSLATTRPIRSESQWPSGSSENDDGISTMSFSSSTTGSMTSRDGQVNCRHGSTAQLPSAVLDELRVLKVNHNKRLESMERKQQLMEVQFADQSIRQDLIEVKGCKGVLIWRISDIGRRVPEAVSGKTPSLYSPPFFTSQAGYKMCARLYLNGDGAGKSSHISLFFVVMRGDYDALLPWPFQLRVKMSLLDQTPMPNGRRGSDIMEVFRPDVTSSSFQKPVTDMNIATGCPTFAPKSVLSSDRYVRDDTIFLKIEIGSLGSKAPDYVQCSHS